MLRSRLKHIVRTGRAASVWINSSTQTAQNKDIDVEEVFIRTDVQSLLYKITGLDMESKVFRERSIPQQQRAQYHLMTDNMLKQTLHKFEDRGKKFLQMVPFKEPRRREFEILAKDPEIVGFDQSKFVFTDITFDATNRDRLVVIRETDGTLRTALPTEHDRMNRVYYEQPDRPVVPPAVFSDPELSKALEKDKHEFILDWGCYFYEPDCPDFAELSKRVFDDAIEKDKFSLLYSTRHFGPLVFYSLLNNKIAPLLEFFGSRSELEGAASLVCLYKTMYPDWRTAISSADTPHRILQDYLKQNKPIVKRVPKLVAALEGKTGKT
ncbi:unnamed protein product [Bursaphelenchus xylophilus]|uniref:(pine wood nematode) hypothetical protein n=1 Tax=Bursaphelenchus xylophilus TaxID=6326 RepID=A0A1I7SWF5_BURXY|nr:unnamed protein product [Bursaphelenchus xylophilus]CAG9099334.1 unnamed protein product [Bursaphelenchus xylophilus]